MMASTLPASLSTALRSAGVPSATAVRMSGANRRSSLSQLYISDAGDTMSAGCFLARISGSTETR
ncbi:hypothetical protein D3C73_1485430 [compost metagenome]